MSTIKHILLLVDLAQVDASAVDAPGRPPSVNRLQLRRRSR